MVSFTSVLYSRNGRTTVLAKYLLLMAIVALANCATKPVPEVVLTAPVNDIDLAEVSRDSKRFQGANVRWGGRIVNTRVADEGLIINVLQYPLGQEGKPLSAEASGGRFVAVLAPPYDKKYFYRNRYITVFGKIDGEEVYPLFKADQRLPRVVVHTNHTWSRERDKRSNAWPWFGVNWHRGGGFGGGIIFQY